MAIYGFIPPFRWFLHAIFQKSKETNSTMRHPQKLLETVDLSQTLNESHVFQLGRLF